MWATRQTQAGAQLSHNRAALININIVVLVPIRLSPHSTVHIQYSIKTCIRTNSHKTHSHICQSVNEMDRDLPRYLFLHPVQ